MAPSWFQIAIVVVLALLLFGGRGKLSGMMGDAAKGIRAFREGLKGDEEKPDEKSAPLPRNDKEDARS